VWSVECGVWSVKCGVSVQCGVRSVECGVVHLDQSMWWLWADLAEDKQPDAPRKTFTPTHNPECTQLFLRRIK
jgi:hypothetical protein